MGELVVENNKKSKSNKDRMFDIKNEKIGGVLLQPNNSLENKIQNDFNNEDKEEIEYEDNEEYESQSENTYTEDNESTFDEFNFDSEGEEEDDTISMESDEEDSDEESDDETNYDDAEFIFDDVKDSIEYINERYNFFKKSIVQECSLYLLYLEQNNVVDVKKINFDLENDGVVSKDKIVELLQEKRILGENKYFIKELWQYNFNIDCNSLINMFDEDEKFDEIENMMKPLNKLSNIRFENSIDVFKDKNSLFVVYTLDKPERKMSSKRKSLKKKYVNKTTTRKTHKKDKKL